MSIPLRRRAMIGLKPAPRLPAGYSHVGAVGKKVTDTSKCHVDTGCVATPATKVCVSYRYIGDVNNGISVVGAVGYSNGTRGLTLAVGFFRWSEGTGYTETPAAGDNVTQTTWYDGTTAHDIYNGTEYTYIPDKNQWFMITQQTLYLLGRHHYNSSGVIGTSPACMVYSMKIWEGNDLVRDFVPCVREADNTAGFYDLAGSVSAQTGTPFYTNMAGTSALAWED